MDIEFTTEEAKVILGSVILLGDTLQKARLNNDPKLKSSDHKEVLELCDGIIKKLTPMIDKAGGTK